MSSQWIQGSGIRTSFITRLHLRLILSHSAVLLPCSLNLKDTVSPQKRGYLGVFESWSDSPSAFWVRPKFEPSFLPVWWAGFPSCFPSLFGFLCATVTHLLGWERGFLPSDQHGPVAPGRGGHTGGTGTLIRQQGGKNTILWILDESPRNVAGGLRKRLKGHQRFWEANLLGRPAATLNLSPKHEPQEQRGSSYLSFRAGYRNGGGTACPTQNHMLFHWPH
jgi:hypothetical protein